MTIADSVWLATALLHQEHSNAADFSVREIIEKAAAEKFVRGFTPGLQVHASKHCVANKSPNPGRSRILFETSRGRRRLFRNGDPFHPDREDGKIRPNRRELPPEYQQLVDWYDDIYFRQSAPLGSSEARDEDRTPRNLATEREGVWNAVLEGLDELQPVTAFVGPSGAIALPKRLLRAVGIKEGSCLSIYRDNDRLVVLPITEAYIRSLRGSCKGDYSLVEDREREHRIEKR